MLSINRERLRNWLEQMAEIGLDPAGGRTRLALGDADKAGRDWCVARMRDLGLEVRVDDVGNVYGRRKGTRPGAPAVMVGSHLDTVPQGGVFDGAMGVLSGLEAVAVLNDLGLSTAHPVEVVSFTNEEGARFEPSIMGSGALAGVFDRDYVVGRTARDDGSLLGDELHRIGYAGSPENRPGELKAFLEYHVEQGPVLESEGFACGVVEGVVGFAWLNVALEGQTDHAGPTPMHMRRDTLVAAGRIAAALRDIARWLDEELVATVGRLSLRPNVINAIPGRCEFSLDIRHADDDRIALAVDLAKRMIARVAKEEGITSRVDEIKIAPAVRFDPAIVDTLCRAAEERGLRYRRMISGAGHDAEYMASLAPTAMIFAPSRDGKSHSPDEWTEWDDVYAGAELLLDATVRLAGLEDGTRGE